MGLRLNKIFLSVFFIFLFTNISASCEEGQIDINTASVEDLILIKYIGESRALQLIELRPFDSVDDLILISGIGEVYLAAIKEQGLACVGEEEEETNTSTEEDEEEEAEKDETEQEAEEQEDEKDNSEKETIKKEIIPVAYKTNNTRNVISASQTIKSGDNTEKIDKSVYAKYGMIAFCLLIILLFIKNKKTYKNEFR